MNALNKKELVTTKGLFLNSKVKNSLITKYIAFDTETTGLNPINDRIIELGAVIFENGKITKSFGTLVNPDVYIPEFITSITNITNEMIDSAPSENVAFNDFIKFLGDALDGNTIICAHNARFDMGFLKATLERLGYCADIVFIDTLYLARKKVLGLSNYKLNTVAHHFDIDNRRSHRAVEDAEVCGKILWKLININ